MRIESGHNLLLASTASTQVGMLAAALQASADSSGDRLSLSAAALARISAAALKLEASPQQVQLVQKLLQLICAADPNGFQVLDLRVTAQPILASQTPVSIETSPQSQPLTLAGSVYSAERQIIASRITLHLSPQLLASEWSPLRTSDSTIGATTGFLLESEVPMAQLLGHALRFEGAIDLRGLWPLQAQLMHGLIRFGRADDDVTEQQHQGKARSDAHDEASTPEPEDEPITAPPEETPDDGGPPRISSGRWLELKLFDFTKRLKQFWRG